MSYIAIVDMRDNNGQHCGILRDENSQWLERFPTLLDIQDLKRRHPLGMFPWIAVGVEMPDVHTTVLL